MVRADYSVGTPVVPLAEVGVIDGRDETCVPQLPLCAIGVEGDPQHNLPNSSVVVPNDFETVFVATRAPVVGPVNETVALDSIAVPNPLFYTFNATYGPAPHHAIDPYAQAWSNHTGLYASALLPDPNSPGALKWWNFRQLEWGSGPDHQTWIGDNRSQVDLRFFGTDLHNETVGAIDPLCEYKTVALVGAACRASGAQEVA
ncbi:MAG: hypothetical protein ACYDCK_07030, partial [Thermoplasmatota archaeon]